MKKAYLVLILILCLSLEISQTSFLVSAEPSTPTTSFSVIPIHELYGMSNEYVAPVGSSDGNYGFEVECFGTPSTDVTITHDNPSVFSPWFGYSMHIECGSIYMNNWTFAPTQPGVSIDNVTFSSPLGTVTKQLVGHGVIQDNYVPQWVANLSPGNVAQEIVYDGLHDYLYISDWAGNQIMVFSTKSRSVVATIAVGSQPVGLALTPDRQKLYVANSGEYSLSVVDLTTLKQAYKIILPSLGPYDGYTPYEIALASDTVALIGSRPPGAASGGPIVKLNLQDLTLTPRTDMQSGRYPMLRTSKNYSATAILIEPGSSPAQMARYDPVTDSVTTASYDMDTRISINADGSQVVSARIGCFVQHPELGFYDKDMKVINRLNTTDCAIDGMVYNPVIKNLLYAPAFRDPMGIAEVDTQEMRQTRLITLNLPNGYGPLGQAMTISDDGKWVYVALVQMGYPPPSKLIAINVGASRTFLPIIKR